MRDLTKLRDEIVQKKALMQAAKAESEVAINAISEVISSFDENVIKVLEEQGFNIREVLTVDIELLKTDYDYVQAYREKVDFMVDKLYELLEAQLV